MTSKEASSGKSFSTKNIGWKHSAATRYVLFLCLAILFYVSLAPDLLPEKYNIQVGTHSEKEITAPMQIPNNKATLKAQEEAAERV
ncbi:metal-dependent phosphohydrolase, partial [Paenibacillus favisporus]|nr:metal-dependent phosphohydrolase [Paenibacillus favisporus]